jgi:prolyl oligopeptidase
MNFRHLTCLAAALTLAACTNTPVPMTTADTPDPYLWLEEVQGDKALAWVRARNVTTQSRLEKNPRYEPTRQQLLAILDARDRIAYVSRRGDWLYNFWKDAKQPRGLWRRTTLAEYRKPEPAWETVLDLDALGAAEKENWVWNGATCLAPDYRRCLLALSRGGADATVVREFDTQTKRFIAAKDGGFVLPEAKSDVSWLNADALLVGSDFGPGSLTDSGYPRVIKRWQRGQPLAQAATVYEGQAKDVAAWASVDLTPGFERTLVGRSTDFYNTEMFMLAGGQPQRIDKPSDASVAFWYEHVLVQLRSDWKIGATLHKAGSLLTMPAAAYLKGERSFTTLFSPTPTRSLDAYTTTRSHVLLTVLDNVAGRIVAWQAPSVGRGWIQRDVAAPNDGSAGTLSVGSWADSTIKNDPFAETYTVNYTDFLTPDSFLLGRTDAAAFETLKRRPAQFDAAGMKVEQHFAKSKDGTRVPYYVVWPKGASTNGVNPTLLYGYGGFEVSQQPGYYAGFGTAWAQHGGVLVMANIRGGGEYGPAWHQAAIKANKQKSYDDFAAVAEDLIARKVTNPKQLGIMGGSNGGLLVGAVMLQRPELFGAVVCQVPLLDMRRYHKLLAGASWMAEYGDPDKPDEWATISKYSPYQNVQNVKPGVKLPPVLFTTSTRDDRVHPGHARKMAARMIENGHDVSYWENIEGGHGGAANNQQRATMQALEFSFLWERLAR